MGYAMPCYPFSKNDQSQRQDSKFFGKIFGVSVDGFLNPGKEPLKEVTAEDKTTMEQMRLLQQLDEEDRQTIFRLIEKILTNKKLNDFFQENLEAL
jgi:hypothetical protein